MAEEGEEEAKDADVEKYVDAFEESAEPSAALNDIKLNAALAGARSPNVQSAKVAASDCTEDRFEESGP